MVSDVALRIEVEYQYIPTDACVIALAWDRGISIAIERSCL